ncbi:MAG: hypothetical protein QOE76_2507 [Frankiales bacterium]|nr:hypothetical protein [Frankiales bacterium]
MKVHRLVGVSLTVMFLAVGPLAMAAPADPTGACGPIDCPGGGNVGTTATGFKYVYSNNAFYKIPTHGPGPGGFSDGDPGVDYEFFYQMDCLGAPVVTANGDVGDLSCNQAGTACANAGGILLLVWYRVVGTTGPPLESRTPLCSQGNEKVTLPDLMNILDPQTDDYLKQMDATLPTVSAQPATSALVNLPTIFSTPDSGTLEMPFLQPMRGTLELVPTYSWDFGDGTPINLTAAGLPYDGTDPQTHGEHYPVLHTFRQAASYNVKATVTWTATRLHIDGLGDFPVTDKTRTFTGALELTAHEAHAVLVSGG